MNLDLILANLRRYSVQIVLLLVAINPMLAAFDAPAWLILAANIAGAIAHHYGLNAKQPEVMAAVHAARAQT